MLEWVQQVTGARGAHRQQRLQSLWSGYGEIVRVRLEGAPVPTVIVKHVTPPARSKHPRGWATDRSHQRKLRSYAVESTFYQRFAPRSRARVATCHGLQHSDGAWLFALEDLDDAGFSERRHQLSDAEVEHCLAWLAAFHATFMGEAPEGLWAQGTYWHLATRPDELEVMAHGPLRESAEALDRALRQCTHRTLIHGDAKTANFCFSRGGPVAAVDFQYVGGGCGMKDVAYLFSCLGARACRKHAARWLDTYFAMLRQGLEGGAHDAAAVETEWRALYPLAWADFERFLAGWAPEHGKRDAYTQEMTRRALAAL